MTGIKVVIDGIVTTIPESFKPAIEALVSDAITEKASLWLEAQRKILDYIKLKGIGKRWSYGESNWTIYYFYNSRRFHDFTYRCDEHAKNISPIGYLISEDACKDLIKNMAYSLSILFDI